MLLYKRLLKRTNTIDRHIGIFFEVLMRNKIGVGLIIIAFCIFLTKTTLFDRVLIKDAFNYVYKGMELKELSFSLFRPQAIGWPVFLSVIYFIFDVETLFEGMFYARSVSILLVCLSVVPLYILAAKLFENKKNHGAIYLLLIAYCLSPLVHFSARNAMTEPLFCFLILWSFVFLAGALEARAIIYSSLFASLAYWVRPNGIFQFAVILLTILLLQRGNFFRAVQLIALATAVFLFVSAPHLLLRYQQFGSPVDYGNNSKYFVESYAQVWDDDVEAPSFSAYIGSHTWKDYYEKFIQNGLFRILGTLKISLQPLWLGAFLCGVFLIIVRKRQEAYPILLLFFVTIGGLSLVYEVFGTIRHLIFLVPFIFLIGTFFISEVSFGKIKISNILAAGFIIYCIWICPQFPLYKVNHIKYPQVNDLWALWAVEQVEGNVAIVEGSSLLRMSQHYSHPAQDRIPLPFNQVEEHLQTIHPSLYPSLADAVIAFRKQNINYLVTDSVSRKKRPYLKELSDKKWHEAFELLKHFPFGDRGAHLFSINVYKIHYDKLPQKTSITDHRSIHD